MRASLLTTLATGLLLSTQAQALNILLTNDDGYDHPNIRALYTELTAQGHEVRISAPWKEQSARGGAFFYGREVVPGRDSDPAYPASHYLKTTEQVECLSPACAGQTIEAQISATPVMALLYGLAQVFPNPDLVISGPNIGHNIGALNNISGTFNAATAALNNGVPAIAVSAHLREENPRQVARIVAQLVRELESTASARGGLLPEGVGLNVNIPRTDQIIGVRTTHISSYAPFLPAYTVDLAQLYPDQAGKQGISFAWTHEPDADDRKSEGHLVGQGYITLSAFSGAPASDQAQLEGLPDLQGLATLPPAEGP